MRVDQTVDWQFMVKGASDRVTATRLEPGQLVEWRGDDGSTVAIDLAPFGGGTAVTITNKGYRGTTAEQVEAALNATEGYSIVVSDLKTLLETGSSAGLTRSKAQLIAARKGS